MATSPRHILLTALLAAALAAVAGSAAAADDEASHRFAGDFYAAGPTVRIHEATIDDVFAAGETVAIEADTGGNLHAVGRQVNVRNPVGGDVYALGYNVEVDSAVTGGVVAAGYNVEIAPEASVGEDVLLGGRYVYVGGPITGNASLGGERVEIAAPITGSVEIRASDIVFSDGARIDGTLAWWSDNPVDVPASVIDQARVTGEIVARTTPTGAVTWIFGGLAFVTAVVAIAALFGWVLTTPVEGAATSFRTRPWRSLGVGVVTMSALIGAIPVFAATIVGIPLVPLVAIVLPLAAIFGYFTSAYMLGRLALGFTPLDLGAAGLTAFVATLTGLVALALLGLIPILGWVIAVFAVFVGLGAWLGFWMTSGGKLPATSSTTPHAPTAAPAT